MTVKVDRGTLQINLNDGAELPEALPEHINLKGDKLDLALCGYLDTTSAPLFERYFNSLMSLPEGKKIKNAFIDFEQLQYLSSAGLRVLLVMHKHFYRNQGNMTIGNVEKSVLEVMNITGFSGLLHIAE
jgi:anti-anti-sigma factor